MESINPLIEAAVTDLRAGKPVLVADSASRENEVDAIGAAATISPYWMAWMVRHTSGYLCAPMPANWADRLELPEQVGNNEDPRGTAYSISCDAASRISTGISAADRRKTLRVLANPESMPKDLIRPGHILPLRAKMGGVAERPGHTEAAVDLMRLSQLSPVGVIGELVCDNGQMMRYQQAQDFAGDYDLVLITIEEIKAYLNARLNPSENEVSTVLNTDLPLLTKKIAEAKLPTKFGDFTVHAFYDSDLDVEHLALLPEGIPAGKLPLVRIHSECLTGEAFGSLKCDCGAQLEESLKRVQAEGGAVIYMRGHEGRGIGLGDKIRAYSLQDRGLDTVDANLELGLPVDKRSYQAAAEILSLLGFKQIRLLSNNPLKRDLNQNIEVVEMVPLEVGFDIHNLAYLRRKKEMGHIFHQLD